MSLTHELLGRERNDGEAELTEEDAVFEEKTGQGMYDGKPAVLCGHPTYTAPPRGHRREKVYVTSLDSSNLSIIRTDIDAIDTTIPLQDVRVTEP